MIVDIREGVAEFQKEADAFDKHCGDGKHIAHYLAAQCVG